jgi:hypothetical protein
MLTRSQLAEILCGLWDDVIVQHERQSADEFRGDSLGTRVARYCYLSCYFDIELEQSKNTESGSRYGIYIYVCH